MANALNKTSLILAGAAALLLAAPASAQVTIYGADRDANPTRSHSVGVMGSMQAIGDSNSQSEFHGYGVIGTTTIMPAGNRDVVVRGIYTMLETSGTMEPEGDNLEFAVLWGSGLRTKGFKWYFGGGYFREKWDFPYLVEMMDGGYKQEKESVTVSNWLATAGAGYNWGRIGIDLWATYKHGNKYDEPFNDVDAAMSANFSITYRF